MLVQDTAILTAISFHVPSYFMVVHSVDGIWPNEFTEHR